jgi:hypothetical protein
MIRRRFIHGMLALLAGTSSIALWRSAHSFKSAEALAIYQLCQAPDSAIRLGKKYLTNPSDKQTAEALAEQIFSDWTQAERRLALSQPNALRNMLAAKIREDFHQRNVFNLSGWVLSKTELQQWALVSLTFG